MNMKELFSSVIVYNEYEGVIVLINDSVWQQFSGWMVWYG